MTIEVDTRLSNQCIFHWLLILQWPLACHQPGYGTASFATPGYHWVPIIHFGIAARKSPSCLGERLSEHKHWSLITSCLPLITTVLIIPNIKRLSGWIWEDRPPWDSWDTTLELGDGKPSCPLWVNACYLITLQVVLSGFPAMKTYRRFLQMLRSTQECIGFQSDSAGLSNLILKMCLAAKGPYSPKSSSHRRPVQIFLFCEKVVSNMAKNTNLNNNKGNNANTARWQVNKGTAVYQWNGSIV